jgi:DNA replication and repair protein RecF
MHISKLRLINFRNIKQAELNFDSAFNVLYGNNGSGKTSMLEAISLLNSSKGMLKAKLSNIINYEATSFGILAQLNNDNQVKLTYQSNKKDFFINNEKIQRLSQLSILGNICWVTPAFDRLFYDSKKPRRDFFDRLVYAIDPHLAKNINTYSYLLQSRIKLLQAETTGTWLDKLEQEISHLGSQILQSRIRYICKLNDELNKYDLQFTYTGIVEKTFSVEIENFEFNDLEKKFCAIFKQNRTKDARFGVTHFGIHKSDIIGLRPLTNLKLEDSSMGQHKKALVDLIIGHVKLVKNKEKTDICLLIDEFTSHLDEQNKNYLFKNLEKLKVQTILTGVSHDDFAVIKNKAKFIKIENGEAKNAQSI